MTQDAQWFDALYRDAADPWEYRTSSYEARKYAQTLALLPVANYRHVLEIGCSIGEMSKLIAPRCERLLALDFAPTAVAAARLLGLPNADFEVATLPRDWPEGRWDLIVMSEVLYYLDPAAIDHLAESVTRSLNAKGHCLLVNYDGDTQTALSGLEAETCFLRAASSHRAVQIRGQISDRGRGYRASVISLVPL